MAIEPSRTTSAGAAQAISSAAERDVMSQAAPAHVDNLRWSLANAEERQELVQRGTDESAQRKATDAQEHMGPSIGAAAGARATDRLNTTPQGLTDRQFDGVAQKVRAEAQRQGLGTDIVVQGSRAARTASPVSDIDLGIRVSPQHFDRFLNEQSRLRSPNPGSNLEETRNYAIKNGLIQAGEARMSPVAKSIAREILFTQPDPTKRVDLSVVRAGGRFDTSPTMEVPSSRAATARAAGQGALVGGAIDGGLAAVHALRDGKLTGAEAGDVLAHSARGAVVGTAYTVTEQGLVRAADRVAGNALERSLSSGARIAGTRLAGAGAAGAVISAGVSIYDNRDGLVRGDAKAIGNVAGDVVVGGTSALGGAAAGAAIGSIVPGVGTAVGAVVGLGVGFVADQALRAGGVDKMIGNAVSGGVDTVKGWFGW